MARCDAHLPHRLPGPGRVADSYSTERPGRSSPLTPMRPTQPTAATQRHLASRTLGTVALVLGPIGTIGAQGVPSAAALDSVHRTAPAGATVHPGAVAPPAGWALGSAIARAGADSSARRRPPRDNRVIVSQVLAGGVSGIGAAFAATVPFLLGAAGGGRGLNETPLLVTMGAAYVTGTVVGVHRAGKHHGLRGSVKGTLIGGAVGLLGGPAVFVTFPLGATVGYQRTRAYRESPQ